MNFKGVGIGLLHDLLGDGIQAMAPQRTGGEPLNVGILENEVPSRHKVFA